MADTGFSSSSGIGGGDPGRDYAPASESQPSTTDSGVPEQTNLQGGVGDRTQGAGAFGGADVQQPSTGDQYGSSGGYGGVPAQGQAQGQGQGDALDKGVDFLERRSGHEMGHSTTEKISDGIRTGFKKLTGKDVPIKDQDYQ